jgi:hypothetical protein
MRWSEAGYLSQFVLAHALRQVSVSLILDVRQKRMLLDDPFSPDADHPIPDVSVCDVHIVRKGGGADLALVIAKPIQNDAKSRSRLMKKLENYLGFIQSEQFKDECGAPSIHGTSITVHIHADSAPAIFTLLQRCEGWVEDNDAGLKILRIKNEA